MLVDKESYDVGKTALFPGCNSLFVEYHDCLGMPKFEMIRQFAKMTNLTEFHEVFTFEDIQGLTDEQLLIWYIARKNRNPLYDLRAFDLTQEECDKILYDQILKDNYEWYFSSHNFIQNIITIASDMKMFDEILVWNEYKDDNIDKFCHERFNMRHKMRHVYGPLSDHMVKLKTHTSCVFSNIRNFVEFDKSELKNIFIFFISTWLYNYKDIENELINLTPAEYDKRKHQLIGMNVDGQLPQLLKELIPLKQRVIDINKENAK
jgi:hypothetical protein